MRGDRSMGGALISAGLNVTIWRSSFQMLPLAAVECAAGYACITLSIVADAPKVVVRSIGKEDVGAQIDRLRCALEAPAEAGKRREVHGGVDGDEHVGVLRH
jgi:hypothetical protein